MVFQTRLVLLAHGFRDTPNNNRYGIVIFGYVRSGWIRIRKFGMSGVAHQFFPHIVDVAVAFPYPMAAVWLHLYPSGLV